MPTSVSSPEVKAAFDNAGTARAKQVTVGGRAVEIPSPFPSPEDWRDEIIYFLLVDRFNNPQAPPRQPPWDGEVGTFQGGTFNGVRAQLDYLQQLGMSALWLSPVLKNCQYNPFTYHGYGIQDFLAVDPRFASDVQAARNNPKLAEDELQALIDEAHARGIYVIFDIVLNHAGDVFAYVLDDGSRVRRDRLAWPALIPSIGVTRTASRAPIGWHRPPRRQRTRWCGPTICSVMNVSAGKAGAVRPAVTSPL